MINLAAFRAIGPSPEYAAQVASLPYDVVNYDEAASLAQGNPYSFLRVVRSDIAFPPENDPSSPRVYEKARDTLQQFIDDSVLRCESEDAVYLYRLSSNLHSQIGVVCLSKLSDLDEGKIKIHEKTRPDKEDDRTQHILTTGVQAEPIFLTYRALKTVDAIVAQEIQREALYNFEANDGIRHEVWKVTAYSELLSALSQAPASYIADGHHRLASAKRACQHIDTNSDTTSDAHRYVLTVLFPDTQVAILPYNRLVTNVSLSPNQIIEKIRSHFSVQIADCQTPKGAGSICMYLDHSWYSLTPLKMSAASQDPRTSLDANVLQEQLLSPVFGIENPRTDPRLLFVGGSRGTDFLVEQVDEGKAVCAFSLFPVSLEQLFAVADAGLTMPPKSTWFEPKLRSGLFLHRVTA